LWVVAVQVLLVLMQAVAVEAQFNKVGLLHLLL
jgi:hypothetical protein